MTNRSYIDAFNPDNKNSDICRKCGVCLQKCPVMKMNKEDSRAEITRLQMGDKPLRVLDECTLCYNCNHYCPHAMNPFALIMERLTDSVVRSGEGIPDYLQYVIAGRSESSVYTDVYQMLSKNDKAILDRWEVPPPKSDEVLFIGCSVRVIPSKIENSNVLKSLPKYGPRHACCGETGFRYGDFGYFSQMVEYTFSLLERLETKRLICYCGGCAFTFMNTWTEYLGVTLPFEIVTIWEWLWEKVQNNAFPIRQRADMKVALADPCYCAGLGDGFIRSVRGLHHASGIEIVELQNNQYDNLCCGAMTLARNHTDLSAPQRTAEKKIKQVMDTEATDLAYYCTGCFLTMADACNKYGIKMHYSLDRILWALGDEFFGETESRLSIQRRFIIETIMKAISGPS